jgi:hypothetical protein
MRNEESIDYQIVIKYIIRKDERYKRWIFNPEGMVFR